MLILRGSVGSTTGDQLKPPGSSRIADVARSPWFEQLALLVIVLNAVWIAVDADANLGSAVNAHVIYSIVDGFFFVFFSIEWFVRFWAYRRKKAALIDVWFCIDTLLLALMIIETCGVGLIMLISGQDYGDHLSVLVVFRLLRVLRLARITRLTQMVPEMRYMVRGMISATRTVVTTLVLVVIVVYVFAVVFVQLTKNTEIGERHFDGVWHAICMLMIQAIAPDHSDLLTELSDEGWYCGALFFVYLLLTTLTMLNMLIGILCEVSSRVADSEKEIMDIDLLRWKLEQIMEGAFDPDYDGRISKSEFLGMIQDKHARTALEPLGVQVNDLMDHADDIFPSSDQDGEYVEGTVSIDEVMQEVLKLRGNNTATIRDITNLQKYVKDAILELKEFLEGGSSRRMKSFMGPPALGTLGNDRSSSKEASRWRQKCQSSQETCEGLLLEVRALKSRIGGIEGVLTEVVQGQVEVQATLQQELPFLACEAAAAHGGGAINAGGQWALEQEVAFTAGDDRRLQHSEWTARKASPEAVESMQVTVNEVGAARHFSASFPAGDPAGMVIVGKHGPEVADRSKVLSGTMDRNKRRYGFIMQDGNQKRVFVLPSQCEAFGRTLPPVGTRLTYKTRADRKSGRMRAEEVQPESARISGSSSSLPPYMGA